jgi:hypothetical protein
MTEYIEREAALNQFEYTSSAIPEKWARIRIEEIPAADVAPVRRGRWIWNPNGMDWGLGAWVCSECHAKPETWWEADKKNNPYRCSGGHFCGNCGARMDGDGDV